MQTILGRLVLKSMRAMLVAAVAALPLTGNAQNISATDKSNAASKAESGFSFIAYGDSRPMMYLPLKEGQPDINKLFVEMFGLVMPEKVAEEVVKRDVKLTFDPVTKELIQVVMPFASKTEVMTLKVDKGWVTEASVEDLKLLPGVHRPRCSVCKGANGSRAKSFETSRAAAPNSW